MRTVNMTRRANGGNSEEIIRAAAIPLILIGGLSPCEHMTLRVREGPIGREGARNCRESRVRRTRVTPPR